MKRNVGALRVITIGAALLLGTGATADLSQELSKVEERWAEIRWQLEEGERLEAYRALIEDAQRVRRRHPLSAKAWIWEGIALAGYADARSDMGALPALRDSRAAYERSIELDGGGLAGFAYANLGTLHHRVPGWPISYGNDDTARELLRRSLDADPDSVDTNYAYGVFLADEGEYAAAIAALERALVAGPGPIHARHHAARLREVRDALERARLALRGAH